LQKLALEITKCQPLVKKRENKTRGHLLRTIGIITFLCISAFSCIIMLWFAAFFTHCYVASHIVQAQDWRAL